MPQMPRIPRALLRRAKTIDPLLPPLLAPCRDLGAAQNELRWLREHVHRSSTKAHGAKDEARLLEKLVKDRASGKPLQYILGTEYFGDLEIQCRSGVLIPRQETAASVSHLAQLISRAQQLPAELRILDLCTGSGCIPLLFQHEFASRRRDVRLRLLGLDISEDAIELATLNAERVCRGQPYAERGIIEFLRADVLIDPLGLQTSDGPFCMMAALNWYRKPQFWDILISNPPYISPSAYWKTTTRSVRHFEPKLALVPPGAAATSDTEQGDQFYLRLLEHALSVEAKITLFEVADLEQALRVARMARSLKERDGNRILSFDGIEIWRDQPDQPTQTELSSDPASESEFPIIGTGNIRSVLCWRAEGGRWLGKSRTD